MFSPERLASLKTLVDERIPTVERIVEMRTNPRPTEEELVGEMTNLILAIEKWAKTLENKDNSCFQFYATLWGLYPNFRIYRETLAELLAARDIAVHVDEHCNVASFRYASLGKKMKEAVAKAAAE